MKRAFVLFLVMCGFLSILTVYGGRYCDWYDPYAPLEITYHPDVPREYAIQARIFNSDRELMMILTSSHRDDGYTHDFMPTEFYLRFEDFDGMTILFTELGNASHIYDQISDLGSGEWRLMPDPRSEYFMYWEKRIQWDNATPMGSHAVLRYCEGYLLAMSAPWMGYETALVRRLIFLMVSIMGLSIAYIHAAGAMGYFALYDRLTFAGVFSASLMFITAAVESFMYIPDGRIAPHTLLFYLVVVFLGAAIIVSQVAYRKGKTATFYLTEAIERDDDGTEELADADIVLEPIIGWPDRTNTRLTDPDRFLLGLDLYGINELAALYLKARANTKRLKGAVRP